MSILNQFNNTKAYLENYSKELAKLLRIEIGRNRTRNYKSGSKSNPIEDTGKLRNSIEVIEKELSSGFSFGIEMNSYGQIVDSGRKSKRLPNITDIATWIKHKPVRFRDSKGKFVASSDAKINSLAFVIARSIADPKVQPTPTNFISDAIKASMVKLNKLGDAVSQDVLLNIEDILMQSGYIKKGDEYILKSEK
jgi:hypothetical protein